jgi:TIR domain
VTKKQQLKMFLSYAHEDADLKDQLDLSLVALKRDERISIWQDTNNIKGGDEWNEKIKEGLQNADIILLLISPNFINSEYIWHNELPIAKQKHEQGQTKVIPIFLRDVFADNMWFTMLQGYISLDKPIAAFKDYDRDTALKKVVQGISSDINSWLSKKL